MGVLVEEHLDVGEVVQQDPRGAAEAPEALVLVAEQGLGHPLLLQIVDVKAIIIPNSEF